MIMKRFLIIFLAFIFSVILGIILLNIFCKKDVNTCVSEKTTSGPLVENGIILIVHCDEDSTENHVCEKTIKDIKDYLEKNIGYDNVKKINVQELNIEEVTDQEVFEKDDFKSLQKIVNTLEEKKSKHIIVIPIFATAKSEIRHDRENIHFGIKKDEIYLSKIVHHIPIFYTFKAEFLPEENKKQWVLDRVKNGLDLINANKESPPPPCEPSGD